MWSLTNCTAQKGARHLWRKGSRTDMQKGLSDPRGAKDGQPPKDPTRRTDH
jgi:hypothetical protein